VCVSVEADRVALVRLRGADVLAAEIVPLAGSPVDAPDVLDVLATRLGAAPWRGAPREVALSDRLVRYLVVDRPRGVRSRRELKAVAQARFASVFDADPAQWRIAMDEQPGRSRVVACGIARELFDRVVQVFGAGGACRAVRPFLAHELARRARRVPDECWLAVAARDCVALAAVSGGECLRIGVFAEQELRPGAIAERVRRESLLHGDVPENAPVVVAGVLGGEVVSSGFTRLDRPNWAAQPAGWSADFRVALAGHWA